MLLWKEGTPLAVMVVNHTGEQMQAGGLRDVTQKTPEQGDYKCCEWKYSIGKRQTETSENDNTESIAT